MDELSEAAKSFSLALEKVEDVEVRTQLIISFNTIVMHYQKLGYNEGYQAGKLQGRNDARRQSDRVVREKSSRYDGCTPGNHVCGAE